MSNTSQNNITGNKKVAKYHTNAATTLWQLCYKWSKSSLPKILNMSTSSTEAEHDGGFEFPSNTLSPSVLVKEDNGKCKRKDIPLSYICVAKAFKGLIQIGGKYDPNDKAWCSQLEDIIKRERKRYYKQGMVEI